MTGKPEVITAAEQGSDRRRNRAFPKPTTERHMRTLDFSVHPSSAILFFQKDLILEKRIVGVITTPILVSEVGERGRVA
jgi:hypothetical protein